MTELYPNYKQILNDLLKDIKSRTKLSTLFEIENIDYDGDTPTLLLALRGTSGLNLFPSKIVESHQVLLTLKLKSKAANIANIADIVKSEAKASSIFPIAYDIKAVESDYYTVTSVENYNISYFTRWNIPTGSMTGKDYERQWDLVLNIDRR